jgi:hypothetical protein
LKLAIFSGKKWDLSTESLRFLEKMWIEATRTGHSDWGFFDSCITESLCNVGELSKNMLVMPQHLGHSMPAIESNVAGK